MLPQVLLSFAGLASLGVAAATQSDRQCENSRYENRHRAFVLTDMSNEPDDQMSLVRLLTYSNEIDIRGIGVVTSVWKNASIDDETVRLVINAYGNVTESLNANAPNLAPYPPASELLSKVHIGHPVYGLASLQLNTSSAALALVKAADDASPTSPLYVQCWGGAAVLAEALHLVSSTRPSNATTAFISNLRVYSISDQDDAGPWIRKHFPTLSYIVSLHSFNEYGRATWNGISGEHYRFFDTGGPDSSLVTNAWLQSHIRVGALGAHYPRFDFIMEGDTPAFFPLVRNGLGDPEHPEWGSWGGRWKPLDPSRKVNVFTDATDWVVGVNGLPYLTSYGTIWRWRKEYQFDFAARMQWTLGKGYGKTNHAPVAIVNGTCGPEVLEMAYKMNDTVVLDASASWDPDGDALRFRWFHYLDVTERVEGKSPLPSKFVKIEDVSESGGVVAITPQYNHTIHIILQLEDDRNMELTTYRRVILYPTA
ncbi:DUF1593-domain-containing protein [Karstenula rhodostoma CBS 690.94]|uniref:DUF1593-domain-containing protein n=1 Tax=Karstenula rhodostoma CBS 690.94 TaxID=1392251 RepID=A0A9P4P9X8_9PLEO|nr:DUF1593-domain-containing protein [Karstenula rhodostoma CBS 690.94]